jgi:hypothetical protein
MTIALARALLRRLSIDGTRIRHAVIDLTPISSAATLSCGTEKEQNPGSILLLEPPIAVVNHVGRQGGRGWWCSIRLRQPDDRRWGGVAWHHGHVAGPQVQG